MSVTADIQSTTVNSNEVDDEYDGDYDVDELIGAIKLVTKLLSFVLLCLFAVVLLLVLMCMQRRKNLWPNCCNRYFALVVPVNLLETRNKRKVFLCAFAIIVLEVLEAIDLNSAITQGDSTYTKFFSKLGFMTMSAVIFLPLLAVIHHPGEGRTIATYILGLMYMLVYFAHTIITCYHNAANVDQDLDDILDEVLLRAVIGGTCGIYLCYWFIKQIIKNVGNKSADKNAGLSKYHTKYVKHLLLPGDRYNNSKLENKLTVDTGKWSKIKRWFRNHIYYNISGFRYSLTILVACTCALVILTKLAIAGLSSAIFAYKLLQLTISAQEEWKETPMPNIFRYVIRWVFKPKDGTEVKTDDIEYHITVFEFVQSQLVIVVVSFGLGNLIAFIGNSVGLCHMLMAYRSNVMNLYQSKQENILDLKKLNNIKLVVLATQFAGYQVAYMMWGYVIQSTFFSLACFAFGEVIILPMQFAFWYFLERLLHFIMPIVIVLVITKITQYLLVRYLFLEDQGKTLAIDNRKGFSIMMYVMLFYTIFTGIFSCLLRIVKCTILGVFLVSRLDRSIFPRTFESSDSGFKTYTCLLHLEALQCNPVLVSFVDILLKTKPIKLPSFRKYSIQTDDEAGVPIDQVPTTTSKQRQLARNRWFVAVTLIRNPMLIECRGVHPYANLFQNQRIEEHEVLA